jgi:hypothetical protein
MTAKTRKIVVIGALHGLICRVTAASQAKGGPRPA